MTTKINGDITKIEADVIVNAANTELIHGGGVAQAIASAAGEILKKESMEIDYCPLGEFAITSAGNLRAKKVVHVPTVDYRNGGKKIITYEMLENVWGKTLEYCQKEGYKTIATPLLGTGVVGLDKTKVEEILSKTGAKFPDFEIKIVEF